MITGVNLRERSHYLPVAVLGQPREIAPPLAKTFKPVETAVRNDRPIGVTTAGLVDVRTIGAVHVQAERPLRVEVIRQPGSGQPGE